MISFFKIWININVNYVYLVDSANKYNVHLLIIKKNFNNKNYLHKCITNKSL